MGAEINQSISEVAKDPMKGGADQAYKNLRSDYMQTSVYDVNVANGKVAAATDEMVTNGVLPQVSAAWLKNEFSRIDVNGNGQIERSELQRAEMGQTRMGALDASLASSVDAQLFDQLASYDQRNGEYNISKSALNRYLRRDDRANQKAINQEEATDALAPLFAGPDPLINYLNKDGNRRVSKHEMKEFLRDYEKFQGNYPYTDENAKFVKDLLHRDIPELHAGINAGFSARHSAKEMGFDSAHGRKHKDFSLTNEEYEQRRPLHHVQEQQPMDTPVGPPGTDALNIREPEKIICPEPMETYKVKKGDCVWNIAKDKLESHHEEVKNREIKRYVRSISDVNGLNKNGRNENLIYPNEVLYIPPIFDASTANAAAKAAREEATVKDTTQQAYFGPEYCD